MRHLPFNMQWACSETTLAALKLQKLSSTKNFHQPFINSLKHQKLSSTMSVLEKHRLLPFQVEYFHNLVNSSHN
jgi:hypothetical protein